MEQGMMSKPRVSFEVEKVLGISSEGNYQVQWAPCWVSKYHLVGCDHLVQEFLRQQQQQQQQRQQQQQQQQQSQKEVCNTQVVEQVSVTTYPTIGGVLSLPTLTSGLNIVCLSGKSECNDNSNNNSNNNSSNNNNSNNNNSINNNIGYNNSNNNINNDNSNNNNSNNSSSSSNNSSYNDINNNFSNNSDNKNECNNNKIWFNGISSSNICNNVINDSSCDNKQSDRNNKNNVNINSDYENNINNNNDINDRSNNNNKYRSNGSSCNSNNVNNLSLRNNNHSNVHDNFSNNNNFINRDSNNNINHSGTIINDSHNNNRSSIKINDNSRNNSINISDTNSTNNSTKYNNGDNFYSNQNSKNNISQNSNSSQDNNNSDHIENDDVNNIINKSSNTSCSTSGNVKIDDSEPLAREDSHITTRNMKMEESETIEFANEVGHSNDVENHDQHNAIELNIKTEELDEEIDALQNHVVALSPSLFDDSATSFSSSTGNRDIAEASFMDLFLDQLDTAHEQPSHNKVVSFDHHHSWESNQLSSASKTKAVQTDSNSHPPVSSKPPDPCEVVTEERVRRFLAHKPMTRTDLLRKFKSRSKKMGLSKQQAFDAIERVLRKIQPYVVEKQDNGLTYICLREQ